MDFKRFLVGPLLAALVFTVAGVYSPVVVAQKEEQSAHSKKPAQFHYVCPMHDNVTKKSPGVCYKCKMKLVRKPLPPPKSDQ